jgi:hypothetical protein
MCLDKMRTKHWYNENREDCRSVCRKNCLVPFCLPQIPHGHEIYLWSPWWGSVQEPFELWLSIEKYVTLDYFSRQYQFCGHVTLINCSTWEWTQGRRRGICLTVLWQCPRSSKWYIRFVVKHWKVTGYIKFCGTSSSEYKITEILFPAVYKKTGSFIIAVIWLFC